VQRAVFLEEKELRRKGFVPSSRGGVAPVTKVLPDVSGRKRKSSNAVRDTERPPEYLVQQGQPGEGGSRVKTDEKRSGRFPPCIFLVLGEEESK